MAAAIPETSAIVPTRGRPAMLARAVASVLAQSRRDLELIVVDDASGVDAEAELAAAERELGAERVRCVRHPERRGAAAARNSGLALARGQYVGFLDDDDEWLPEKLALQAPALERGGDGVALVHSGREIVSDRSRRTVARIAPVAREIGFADLLRSTVFPTSVPLLRRSCLEAVGGFDETLPGAQDRDLWLRLARRWRFVAVPDVLVRTHLHGDQISTDLAAKISAKELWLDKYRLDLRGHPRAHAHELRRLGILQAASGRAVEARRSFLRALRVRPLDRDARAHLAASLLAPERHRLRVLREEFQSYDGITLYW